MLFSKQTPAAGGTAFAQFDAAWCYDGNGYILNDTGTSLDVRIGASGSVITLAASALLPIKLVNSMAELYVRRTDQSTTQVTVEAQIGTGSAGGGTTPVQAGVIAATAAAAAVAGLRSTDVLQSLLRAQPERAPSESVATKAASADSELSLILPLLVSERFWSARYGWPVQEIAGVSIRCTQDINVGAVEFVVSGDAVEVTLSTTATTPLAVSVAGRRCTDSLTTNATGDTIIRVAFDAAEIDRTVLIETFGATWKSVAVATTSTVQKPASSRPKMLYVGDSVGVGSGSEGGIFDGVAYQIARRLGVDLYNNSIGGSGYTIGSAKYYERLSRDELVSEDYDIIFIQGSGNDAARDGVREAALSFWAQVRTAFPRAAILISTTYGVSRSDAEGALNSTLRSAFAEFGDRNSHFVECYEFLADGLAGYYSDQYHPSTLGHSVLAIGCTDAIRSALRASDAAQASQPMVSAIAANVAALVKTVASNHIDDVARLGANASGSFAVLVNAGAKLQIEIKTEARTTPVAIYWGDGSAVEVFHARAGNSISVSRTWATSAERVILIAGQITALESDYYDGRTAFSGDIYGLRDLSRLAVYGANLLSGGLPQSQPTLEYVTLGSTATTTGDVSGFTKIKHLNVGGNTGISGSLAGLTLLEDISLGGTNTVTGLDAVAQVATRLCDIRHYGGRAIPTSEVNGILRGLVINIATPKPYAGYVKLDASGDGAPTGQGVTDKATLISAGWTVLTN